jgi:hypothetical protein
VTLGDPFVDGSVVAPGASFDTATTAAKSGSTIRPSSASGEWRSEDCGAGIDGWSFSLLPILLPRNLSNWVFTGNSEA